MHKPRWLLLLNFVMFLLSFEMGFMGRPNDALSQTVGVTATLTTPNDSKKCSPVKPGSHESYRLPPAKNLPEGISFTTDWAEIPTGGWAGQQAMDSCRMQRDGYVTWHGKVAVRVEVQPTDDPLDSHANSERAEVLFMQDANGKVIKENSASGTQYYATSYYFPTTWQGQQLPWFAFAPIDCLGDGQNICNSWSFVWQFFGWGGMSAARTAVNGPEHYLFNGSRFTDGGLIKLGKWTDFVFMVDWGTGSYTVWRRDEGQTTFTQVLVGKTAVPSGREVYAKQGLYRGGNVGGRTDVLWIGPTARGASFSAVERQAFGTDNGRSDDALRSPQ
jgi:hypothetical protein